MWFAKTAFQIGVGIVLPFLGALEAVFIGSLAISSGLQKAFRGEASLKGQFLCQYRLEILAAWETIRADLIWWCENAKGEAFDVTGNLPFLEEPMREFTIELLKDGYVSGLVFRAVDRGPYGDPESNRVAFASKYTDPKPWAAHFGLPDTCDEQAAAVLIVVAGIMQRLGQKVSIEVGRGSFPRQAMLRKKGLTWDDFLASKGYYDPEKGPGPDYKNSKLVPYGLSQGESITATPHLDSWSEEVSVCAEALSQKIFTANEEKAGWIPEEHVAWAVGRGTWNYLFGHLDMISEKLFDKKPGWTWGDNCGKDDHQC